MGCFFFVQEMGLFGAGKGVNELSGGFKLRRGVAEYDFSTIFERRWAMYFMYYARCIWGVEDSLIKN